jgi:hypothetical protein
MFLWGLFLGFSLREAFRLWAELRREKGPRVEDFIVGWVVCFEGGQNFSVVHQCRTLNRERAECMAYEAMMRDVEELEATSAYGFVKPISEQERPSWFTSKGDVI